MNTPPLVSIITPAYNAADFIEATIRSALAQTHRNIEMIVVDDGSTDGTAVIVKAIAKEDPRLHYIYQENAGQSAARNMAIAHARGKYVALLDADDLFMPTKIEEQAAYMEAHPECGLCYCKVYHFFDPDREQLYMFDVPSPSGALFKDLLRGNFINPLSVVIRKETLDAHGAFEPTFRRVDEQYLWMKLAWNGVMFCHLPKPLAYYRVHGKGLTNEATHFLDTETQFLKLLATMKASWLTPAQAEEYQIDALARRARKRLFIGKILAGNNPFSWVVRKLYYWNRIRRMHPVGA